MSKTLKGVVTLTAAVMGLALPVFAGVPSPPTTVPEPATLALLASGLGVVVGARHYLARKK